MAPFELPDAHRVGDEFAALVPIERRGFAVEVDLLAVADGLEGAGDSFRAGGVSLAGRRGDCVEGVAKRLAVRGSGVLGGEHQRDGRVVGFARVRRMRRLVEAERLHIVGLPVAFRLGDVQAVGLNALRALQDAGMRLVEVERLQLSVEQDFIEMGVPRQVVHNSVGDDAVGEHGEGGRLVFDELAEMRVVGFGRLLPRARLRGRQRQADRVHSPVEVFGERLDHLASPVVLHVADRDVVVAVVLREFGERERLRQVTDGRSEDETFVVYARDGRGG